MFFFFWGNLFGFWMFLACFFAEVVDFWRFLVGVRFVFA